jgi:hypothetical protein
MLAHCEGARPGSVGRTRKASTGHLERRRGLRPGTAVPTLAPVADSWNFLSTHGLVLVLLSQQPDMRLRDIAAATGITERAAQNVVNHLVATGYVQRTRVGRRNRYVVRGDRLLPQSGVQSRRVGEMARVLASPPTTAAAREPFRAVVIACSDHRIQGQLRQLLAVQGLLDRAETVLWPGAPWSVDTPAGRTLLETVKAVAPADLERVLLVAHRGCVAPGAPAQGEQTLRQAISRLRGTISVRVRETLGLVPETWFVDEAGLRGSARSRRRSEPAVASAAPPASPPPDLDTRVRPS